MSAPIRVVFFDAADTLFHVYGSVAEIYLRHAIEFGFPQKPDSLVAIKQAFSRAFREAPPPVFAATEPARIKQSERVWWFDIVHHVLVMSVNPGFGAQKFIRGSLRKIEMLAQIRERRGLSFRIEVDGGIDLTTVSDVVRAGADLLVAGNAVFAHGDIRENARKLLLAARGATAMRA